MRSSSVSKLVGASDFIHIDDLEVRGSVPSNRKPSLARGRGCPGLYFYYIYGSSPEMALRFLLSSVVAADQLRRVGRTLSRRAGAADELLGSAGGHPAHKFSVRAGAAQRAIESRWGSGVRARHGQGAGRAGAVEADGEGCPDALKRYVRVACVSLCRSVSSHENARVPHAPVPWQVVLHTQRLRR